MYWKSNKNSFTELFCLWKRQRLWMRLVNLGSLKYPGLQASDFPRNWMPGSIQVFTRPVLLFQASIHFHWVVAKALYTCFNGTILKRTNWILIGLTDSANLGIAQWLVTATKYHRCNFVRLVLFSCKMMVNLLGKVKKRFVATSSHYGLSSYLWIPTNVHDKSLAVQNAHCWSNCYWPYWHCMVCS